MNKVRMSCAALILAACSVAVAAAQQSAILERIIVKVNGEILTQTQLEDLQIEAMREQNKQVENRKALSNEDVRKVLIEITPAILVEEVDKLLMVQRARELSFKYSDEMFKQNIDNIKKQNPDSIKTDADLERALKEAGLTMAKLRQNFEKAFFVYEIERREIARNITLTEEEARQYYKAHPQEFMKPRDRDAARDSGVGARARHRRPGDVQCRHRGCGQDQDRRRPRACRWRRGLSEIDRGGVGFRHQSQ